METLIYFLLWVGVMFLLERFRWGVNAKEHGHRPRTRDPVERGNLRWIPPEEDIDPVCTKTVRPEKAKPSVQDGMVYYFCSRECREIFEAAPDQYTGPEIDSKVAELGHGHG